MKTIKGKRMRSKISCPKLICDSNMQGFTKYFIYSSCGKGSGKEIPEDVLQSTKRWVKTKNSWEKYLAFVERKVVWWVSHVVLVVKNPPANAGDARDAGLIPRLGRSIGDGSGNPLQYSCLESPMDRGAWQATVHGSQRVWHNWATKPPHYEALLGHTH